MFTFFSNLIFGTTNHYAKKIAVPLVFVILLFATFSTFALAQGNVLTADPQNFDLVEGWYKGRQTLYYEFGTNSTATADGQHVVPAPIYAFVTGFDGDGNPQFVEGQNNIVDVIPGDEGYSDLWEVVFVTVPEDYAANSITSVDEVLAGGYDLIVPGVYVNCPIVPAGSTLAEGGSDLVQGWYKGQEIFYFEFNQEADITAPIYAFVTGFDGDGNPQFVEGQNNVIDVIPGDEGYSAFWNVNLVVVPEDYTPNSITAVDDILASGYDIQTPGLLVNCPVLRTADLAASGESPAELPTTGAIPWNLGLAYFGIGAVLAGVGLILFEMSLNKGRSQV